MYADGIGTPFRPPSMVRRLCQRAGMPLVGTHSIRALADRLRARLDAAARADLARFLLEPGAEEPCPA